MIYVNYEIKDPSESFYIKQIYGAPSRQILQTFPATKITPNFIKLLQTFSAAKLTLHFIKLICVIFY